MVHKALLSLAICSSALAQSSSPAQERVFTFVQPYTPPAMQQMASTLRTIANIQQISVDAARRTLTVQCNATKADLAEWIFKLLDIAGPMPGANEYTIPGGSDDVVRVFYAPHADGPQKLYEVVNAVRTVSEVQRVAAFTPAKAVVIRGRVRQASLSDWLIRQLDSPPAGQLSASYTAAGLDPTFKARGLEDPVAVRVYYMPQATTTQALQDVADQMRSQLQIMRIVACTGPHAIALRGTEGQAQASDRMLTKSGK